jgi:hypothetical protein
MLNWYSTALNGTLKHINLSYHFVLYLQRPKSIPQVFYRSYLNSQLQLLLSQAVHFSNSLKNVKAPATDSIFFQKSNIFTNYMIFVLSNSASYFQNISPFSFVSSKTKIYCSILYSLLLKCPSPVTAQSNNTFQ